MKPTYVGVGLLNLGPKAVSYIQGGHVDRREKLVLTVTCCLVLTRTLAELS